MTATRPVISVILLNYNGKEFLKISIRSLINQTHHNYEIILVDNGSTDGSIEFVVSNYPQIRIVKSPHNSFSVGNNMGIRQATGDYIFILNNDVELDRNCLEELMKIAMGSQINIGMWATKILNYDHRDIIDTTGLLIYPDGMSRGRGRLEADKGQYDDIEEVCFPSGCAGLYKKTMLDEIGLFDEDFSFFVEDSDLGFRARLCGWRCLFIPNAKVYHMYSATAGKYSQKKAFLVERNRIWLAIKLYPLPILLISPFYTFLRYLYQILSVLLKKGSAGKFTEKFSGIKLFLILLEAWFSAFEGVPRMLRKRKIIQRNKKVSNKEIYLWFKRFGISTKELTLKN